MRILFRLSMFLLVFPACFALTGCEKDEMAETTVTTREVTLQDFQNAGNVHTPDETDEMLFEGEIGQSPQNAFVPLVFTDQGTLYTVEAYNSFLDGMEGIEDAEYPEPETWYTTLKVYEEVTGQTGLDEYARILPLGKDAVWAYDPYSKKQMKQSEIEEVLDNATASISPRTDMAKYDCSYPSELGSDLWVGDIGVKYQATSISGIFGHSGIVVELDNGGITGGNAQSSRTKNMEALGYYDDDRDEVQRVPFKNYWVTDNARWQGLIYSSETPSSKLSTIARFAKWQDRDTYSITTSKSNTSKWYCSKLSWIGYKRYDSKDFDYDGGSIVFPVDLLLGGHYRTDGAVLYSYYSRNQCN